MDTAKGNNDLDVMDIAVTVAESWRLLLIVPLIVAAITAGILLSIRPQYVSYAALNMTIPADLLTARSVLDPVVEKLNLRKEYGPQMDVATDAVRRRLTVTPWNASPNDKSKVVAIESRFPSPELARDVLKTLIDEVRKQSVPRFAQREKLENEIATLKDALAGLQKYSDAIQKNTNNLGAPSEEESRARSIAAIVNTIVAQQKDLKNAEDSLQGMGQDAILSGPTTPDRAASKGVAALSVIAAFASGVAIFAFVFLRASFRRAGASTVGANKLKRFQAALRLRRTTSV